MLNQPVVKWSSIGLLGVGVSCLLAFQAIGSEIDARGFLHEPFVLIPIGYFFLALGLLLGILHLIARLVRAIRKN